MALARGAGSMHAASGLALLALSGLLARGGAQCSNTCYISFYYSVLNDGR